MPDQTARLLAGRVGCVPEHTSQGLTPDNGWQLESPDRSALGRPVSVQDQDPNIWASTLSMSSTQTPNIWAVILSR